MNIDVKYDQLLDFINRTDEFIYKLIATGSQGITGKLKMELINCEHQYYLLATTKSDKSIVMKINILNSVIDANCTMFQIEVETDGLLTCLTMKFVKSSGGIVEYTHLIEDIKATKISMKPAMPIINMATNTVIKKATPRINKKVEWVVLNEKLNGQIRYVSSEKLNDIKKAGVLDFIKELS